MAESGFRPAHRLPPKQGETEDTPFDNMLPHQAVDGDPHTYFGTVAGVASGRVLKGGLATSLFGDEDSRERALLAAQHNLPEACLGHLESFARCIKRASRLDDCKLMYEYLSECKHGITPPMARTSVDGSHGHSHPR